MTFDAKLALTHKTTFLIIVCFDPWGWPLQWEPTWCAWVTNELSPLHTIFFIDKIKWIRTNGRLENRPKTIKNLCHVINASTTYPTYKS